MNVSTSQRLHLECASYGRATHIPGRPANHLERDQVGVEPIVELAPLLVAVNVTPATPNPHTTRHAEADARACLALLLRRKAHVLHALARRRSPGHARACAPCSAVSDSASQRAPRLSSVPIEPRSAS